MKSAYSFEWTAEAIAEFRQFWREGLSASQIGRRMGVSKNAVVGKARRLDLPKRRSPIRLRKDGGRWEGRPKREVVVPPKLQKVVLPSMAVRTPQFDAPPRLAPTPFRPLQRTDCCYLIPAEGYRHGLQCTEVAVRGSYCEEHAKLCNVRLPSRYAAAEAAA